MLDAIRDFEYLWDGSQPDWVLVRNHEANAHEGGLFSIFNKKTNMLCLIEDAEVHKAACDKLMALGVEILDRIPEGEFNIENLGN